MILSADDFFFFFQKFAFLIFEKHFLRKKRSRTFSLNQKSDFFQRKNLFISRKIFKNFFLVRVYGNKQKVIYKL